LSVSSISITYRYTMNMTHVAVAGGSFIHLP
jgi:hypothetical protein